MPSCTQAGEEDMPLHVQDRSAEAASTYCSGGSDGCLPTIGRRRRNDVLQRRVPQIYVCASSTTMVDRSHASVFR
ncbi:hypothetical protein BRADI_5g10668v3 [Brachypodium distachyon]|uniref:Uncharacterized protein n=1 Tax=Brachypodium distachyon TaxID=15368 RepID=A0A2K2CGH1_BRADI|nr:hypothetical protein BRADI_5g10668v3 [Brachypodium distachyon]